MTISLKDLAKWLAEDWAQSALEAARATQAARRDALNERFRNRPVKQRESWDARPIDDGPQPST